MNFHLQSSACSILLTFLWLVPQALADELPPTRAGTVAGQCINLINNGDLASAIKFTKKRRVPHQTQSPEDRAKALLTLRERFGRLSIESFLDGGENEITVFARGKSSWLEMQFVLESSEPHRLDSILISISQEPPSSPKALQWSDKRGAMVKEYLTRLARIGFCGNALIIVGDKTVFKRSFGWANRAEHRPMKTDAVMTLGSITKSVTGAAIALLESRGKISLDDPMSKFLPDVPEDKRGIKIRHLLTHSAGFPGAVGHDHDMKATREWVRKEAFRRPLEFPPGTARSYSNTGYSLLAMIIENISGLTYEQFVTENFFGPSGMKDTGYVLPRWKPDRLPTGYRDGKPTKTFVDLAMFDDGPNWNLRGNGGILTTVEDMEKWITALRSGKLLASDKTTKRYLKPIYGGTSLSYGYGLGHTRTRRGTRLVEHDGGNMVFNADLHMYVDEGVAIFMNSSIGELPAEQIIDQVESIVFGHDFKMPPKVIELSDSQIASIAGSYNTPGGDTIEISSNAGHLVLTPSGPSAFDLLVGGDGSENSPSLVASSKAVALAQAVFNNDMAVLLKLLPGSSREQIKEMFRPDRQRAEAHFGPFKAAEAIGVSRGDNGGWRIVLKCEFDKGPDYIAFEFNRYGGLQGIDGVRPGGTSADFYPTSATVFERFSLTSQAKASVEFRDGAAWFQTDAGTIQCKR